MSLNIWTKLTKEWEKVISVTKINDLIPSDRTKAIGVICLTATVVLCPIGISPSEIFLAMCVLLIALRPKSFNWISLKPIPSYFFPMMGFILWSLLSIFVSQDPLTSLANLKKLLLFILIPLFPLILDRISQCRVIYLGLYATMGISAVFGILQYPNVHNLLSRIHGFMGHHMTFAGQLAIILIALVAFLVTRKRWRSPAVLTGLIILILGVTALTLTMTRSAWLGFAVGAFLVLLLLKPRWTVIIPIAVILIFLISPATVKNRFEHFFDTTESGNAARLDMWQTGLRMVQDRPLFGVGPTMVSRERSSYGANPKISKDFYIHLHNNIIQLAAERGIPALLFWLWFMGSIVISNFRFYMRIKKTAVNQEILIFPVSTIAVTAALFISGLFEFNFGDSEVLIIFLSMVGLSSFVRWKVLGDQQNAAA